MYRIKLKSKTGFFRNDLTITGIQETYDCPPLSTIYGIISSATGEKIQNINVGYIFEYAYKSEDYELQITQGAGKKDIYKELRKKINYIDRHDILQGCFSSAPVTRQILFDCTLYIYLENDTIAENFRYPYFSILMGRSEDICMVEEIKKIDLKEKRFINVGNTIIPLREKVDELYGKVVSMPVNISYEIPRHLISTDIYLSIPEKIKIRNSNNLFLYDDDIGMGVYIHKFN
ncbi:MAG TPA: type I-B CRISPR-associated protein Cas5 [Clostridiaceae bacterium]|nr:type I-B CRISPR-associated protein Cas5 [Clostridiaceae bacterium]